MDVNFFKLFFSLSVLFLSTSCCSQTNTHLGYTVLSQVKLGDDVKETSGLVCDETGIYSLNDSGNPSMLYTLDEQGNTTAQKLKLRNKDWEALTATKSHFFIADIGNNSGKRKNLWIYKVNRNNFELEDKLTIRYKANEPSKNATLAHDFDGEAITYKDAMLVLFSKSWKSNIAKVYLVDPNVSDQELTPHTTIEGLPGVITGADFNPLSKTFTVVGYDAGRFGFSVPFLATLSSEYKILKVFKLSTFGQVEGVCERNNVVWFTQEKTPFKSAKLVSLTLN